MKLVVDGREAYAYTGGKPFDPALPCVVFVHGALNDHSVWTLLARWFAHHGHSVLALDLPGHSRSEGPALASVEEMALWLLRVLDAAGVAQAALVGHSMGSLVALEAAARAPGRITRLVMVGTAYPMKVSDALLGTARERPLAIPASPAIVTPDSAGPLADQVLIYDDDNYYMGGALAEKLALEGRAVTYVTTQPILSAWTQMTDEQPFIEERLVSRGVSLHVSHLLQEAAEGLATFRQALSREPVQLPYGSLIMVTGRVPQDDLYTELLARPDAPPVSRIGDCHVPSHIADAVYAGHRFAREFDASALPILRRERPEP